MSISLRAFQSLFDRHNRLRYRGLRRFVRGSPGGDLRGYRIRLARGHGSPGDHRARGHGSPGGRRAGGLRDGFRHHRALHHRTRRRPGLFGLPRPSKSKIRVEGGINTSQNTTRFSQPTNRPFFPSSFRICVLFTKVYHMCLRNSLNISAKSTDFRQLS